jgi:hypothetical protein
MIIRNVVFLCLIISHFSFAQKDVSVSVLGGINNYNIKGLKDYSDNSKYLNYYENEKGYFMGLGGSLNFKKRSFFNVQFLYSTLSYNAHQNEKFIFNNPADSNKIPVKQDISVGYFDIPLSYGLHIINPDSSKFRFYTQIGIRPSFLIHSKNTITALNGEIMNNASNPIRKFTLTPFFGVGFGYSFSEKITANINLFYNQHFNAYDSGGGKFPNNIPLFLSIDYSL